MPRSVKINSIYLKPVLLAMYGRTQNAPCYITKYNELKLKR